MGDALRPVQYLGNKSRYLDRIVGVVGTLVREGDTVLDLFAGSGVVSRALANSYQVTSVDVQAYSATLTDALCSPVKYGTGARREIVSVAHDWADSLPAPVARLVRLETQIMDAASEDPSGFVLLSEEGSTSSLTATRPDLADAKVAARDHLLAAGAVLTANYGGVYFSYRQALELDAIQAAIRHVRGLPGGSTLVAALLSTASNVVSTVGGHFAQPLRLRGRDGKPKMSAISKSLSFREKSVFNLFDIWLEKYGAVEPSKFRCSVVTSDYRDVIASVDRGVSAIYADPPYTRDHYSRFYHVLETIALGDNPGVASKPGTTTPSRGLYRLDRHQSPFSIRSQANRAFAELFEYGQRIGAPMVLSYSPQGGGTTARPETRVATIDNLVKMAESSYARVEVISIGSSVHSRFNRTDLHGTVPADAEMLLVARP
ncbi:DNA adenine methylase [Microbacterium sp. SORGH_AS_0421]|uniref:DNA adenine methylase n=1 Tax=Microbacterium sp. SORGH_AS_0421 TaxID=3041768 RepID=UPI00278E4EF4|nr:adenine-specific DNA-methyltransferase [Microbacterium sp. SORGH_AS_0421]